jgi:hypothetical protein
MFARLALACSFALLSLSPYPAVAAWQSAVGGPAPAPAKVKPIVYTSRQYGFRLELPPEWKGYAVVMNKWEGQHPGDPMPSETGPIIVLRDPRWTPAKLYQDIPIMVFTKAQWEQVVSDNLIVSAAPIGPQKIGGNASYVFALPPRYAGFTEAEGQQAVVDWMRGNHLHTF